MFPQIRGVQVDEITIKSTVRVPGSKKHRELYLVEEAAYPIFLDGQEDFFYVTVEVALSSIQSSYRRLPGLYR